MKFLSILSLTILLAITNNLHAQESTVNFSGYYEGRLKLVGKPIPIINKKGNIKLKCSASKFRDFQMFVEQDIKNKVFVDSTDGILKGKAKKRTLKAKGKSVIGKIALVIKEDSKRTKRVIKTSYLRTLEKDVQCKYNYKSTFKLL